MNLTRRLRVFYVLQSKTVLELKLLELVPDLTLLGETFEEASELEIAHNHVLQQLQVKINSIKLQIQSVTSRNVMINAV